MSVVGVVCVCQNVRVATISDSCLVVCVLSSDAFLGDDSVMGHDCFLEIEIIAWKLRECT